LSAFPRLMGRRMEGVLREFRSGSRARQFRREGLAVTRVIPLPSERETWETSTDRNLIGKPREQKREGRFEYSHDELSTKHSSLKRVALSVPEINVVFSFFFLPLVPRVSPSPPLHPSRL